MSLENEDQSLPDKASETFHQPQKQSKISYTREFLLSLSELDICKKLPSGFDRSLISEFEDVSYGIQDRQRIPGSLPLQSFRRSEYGSSPPTRGDSITYSRGIHGRWDNRSAGWSEKDSDSQSDRDSESGRRYVNQSRRSWQSPEHDGLLGSGSFPRPSGYAAGMSAPKVRANDQSQLNRSNEPYQPPRPYKAVPQSRRETNDSLNDETFGSTECASENRAEEERRRRASFEMMRKEQQKALQEKQKLNRNKHKGDGASDISVLLEETKEEKRLWERNNELVGSATLPVSNNDCAKSSFPSHTPASRPLVPPGFTSAVTERNSDPNSLIQTHEKEVGKPEIEESLLHTKAISVPNGSLGNQSVHEMNLNERQLEDRSIHAAFLNDGENIVDSSSVLEVSNKTLGLDDHLYRNSSLSEAHEVLGNGEIIELATKKVTGDKIVTDSNQDNSTSILEKLFGSVLTVNVDGSSGFIEHHSSKPDDTRSPHTVQSSKFAHWFLEDEKKSTDDLSSGRSSDLLSLLVGGEKGGSQVSDMNASQHVPLEFSYQSSEPTNTLTSNIPLATTTNSEQLYNCDKQEAVPAVLTCEDLEQTILSEHIEKSSTSQPPVQDWSVSGAKPVHPEAHIDNRASQHLLSLLQKGTDLKDMTPYPIIDIETSDKLYISELGTFDTARDEPKEAKAENIHMGKSLTLETLFGTAFMKELQSVDAPVSIQRGSVGPARIDVETHGLLFPGIDDGLFPSTIDEIGSNRRNHGSSALTSNQKNKLDKVEDWLGFDDPQIEVGLSKFQTEVVPKHGGFNGAVEIQLPEEESLIMIDDPVNPQNSMFLPAGNLSKGEFLSSHPQIHISEKLAALNAGFKDERSMLAQEGPFVRGPYDLIEPERRYHNLHAQPPSPRFHPPQLNHGRPLFHPLDSRPAHFNSQMKFMSPESIMQQDGPSNHQFPANMLRPPFNHPNTRLTGFDIPSRHQMLQQLQMPGSFPPPHLLHEFPRGALLPPHPRNQATGFIQEPSPTQGFPFVHRQPQPNTGGLGMPLPAPDAGSGGNHPEAFQRLIEMELRANSKQMHPFGHGHELDMGFRYR